MFACLAVLLAGVLALSGLTSNFEDAAAMVPPEVLADRSEQLLSELGLSLPARGSEWGFLDHVVASDPIDRVLFWHRQSVPRPLPLFVDRAFEASTLASGVDVPATLTSENLFIMFDPTGDLVYLNAGAPFGSMVGGPAGAFDTSGWARLFEAAGLDRARMVPDPGVEIPVFGDQRAAWITEGNSPTGAAVRVQAASFRGRPVFFAAETTDASSKTREDQLRRRSRLDRWVRTPLYLLVVIAALGLGVHSVVRERSDLRGAAVLAATVVGVGVLASVLTMGRVRHPLATAEMAVVGSLLDIVAGSIAVGLCYLGLEPLIRRHRPHALIAWTRLLAWNPRNEAVGLSVTVGAVAGSLWAIIQEVDRVVLELLGFDLTWGWLGAEQLNAAIGLGNIFGAALREVEGAIVGGLLIAVLFALLGRFFARRALAWVAFVAVVGLVYGIDAGAHLPASVPTVGLAAGVLSLVLLDRFGLLALVVAMLCNGLLTTFPMTLDRDVWFAGAGYFAIVVVLFIGVAGLLIVRADRGSRALRSTLKV